MDLNFQKVSYDGDLEDFSEEELRELIPKFENAQESNVAEFEEAADKLDAVSDVDLDEFEDARADLIGEITEADAFEDVPLTEDELEETDFGKLRDWHDFVTEQDDDEDGEFEDMGQEGQVRDGDGSDFNEDVVELVDGLSGVNVQTE